MNTLRKWLIVKANGDARITKRKPSALDLDEIAFEILVHMPNGWGKIHSESLTLKMPDEIPGIEEAKLFEKPPIVGTGLDYGIGDRYMDHAGIQTR